MRSTTNSDQLIAARICQNSRVLTQFLAFAKSTAWLCQKSGTKQAYEDRLAWISTEDQNPDLQLAALKQAGCQRIFTDKATGTHVKRPKLTKCLKALAHGDTLVIWKPGGLGRSLRDIISLLVSLLDDLKARGVKTGRKPKSIWSGANST